MRGSCQGEGRERGRGAGEMVLSWGKMNAGCFDVGWRLQSLAVQVEEGQQVELWGPMAQEGQPGQRLGERAVKGARGTRERGWREAVGQGQQEVELPGPGVGSGGVAEQGGLESEACHRWTPQVLQHLLQAAGGECERWHEHEHEHEHERESVPGPGQQGLV